MAGENLPMVGKLLGHRRHRTTAGYAHLADGHLVKAAEEVGTTVAQAMGMLRPEPNPRSSGSHVAQRSGGTAHMIPCPRLHFAENPYVGLPAEYKSPRRSRSSYPGRGRIGGT